MEPIWTLQPKRPLPGKAGAWFWNSRKAEYTQDLAQATTFNTEAEGQQWLRAHKYAGLNMRLAETAPPAASA
jgi:hypothetical protein